MRTPPGFGVGGALPFPVVRAWLFRGNPERWRIFDYLRDHPDEDFTGWRWSCARYRDLVRRGDGVALWLSGPPAVRGVHAAGRITGEPYPTTSDDEYWTDPADRRRPMWSVDMTLDRVFFGRPVLATELRGDPRFWEATILRTPRAANPHPLAAEEWEAIAERLPRGAGARAGVRSGARAREVMRPARRARAR